MKKKRFFRQILIIFMLAFLIDRALIGFFNIEFHEKTVAPENLVEEFAQFNISQKQLLMMKESAKQQEFKYPSNVTHFEEIGDMYKMALVDVNCFPIGIYKEEDKKRYEYEDTFLSPRTYGGNRKHMGTDLLDVENQKGYFAIQSMTDGVVENIGWLELGGYRIGIKAPGGAYFYYAHLEKYAPDIDIGDKIYEGQLLGYMGNTGYGPEVTKDKFIVHLHIGIMVYRWDGREVWINPYSILKMLDPKENTEEN